jgi:AcrR family transcriptional regulator
MSEAAQPADAHERRLPLTKERVLTAAVAFADEEGVDALSMRRLAKELGVEAMSLYNHVTNKDEILAGIIDRATAEIELPEEPDWKASLRRGSISAKEVFLRHPWLARLMMSRQSGGPAGLRRAEWLLRTLREAGFSGDLTYHAYHILEAYLQGITSQHLGAHGGDQSLEELARGFLRGLPAGQYEHLVEHVEQHLEPAETRSGGFELGLDLILDGLERLRESR